MSNLTLSHALINNTFCEVLFIYVCAIRHDAGDGVEGGVHGGQGLGPGQPTVHHQQGTRPTLIFSCNNDTHMPVPEIWIRISWIWICNLTKNESFSL